METSASQIKKTKKTKQQIQQEPATQVQESVQEQSQPEQKEIRLVDIPINDENVALNVMVGFLNVAHKRGVFTIDESAKIWECISKFQK
jgi:glutathione synthase/RimK-type ligase-like ATP-grasp enzyme